MKYIETRIVDAERAMLYIEENATMTVTESQAAMLKESRADDFKEIKAFMTAATSQVPGFLIKRIGDDEWVPAAIFRADHLRLGDGENVGRPSITEELVDRFIASKEVKTMGRKTTVVRATLRNGFEIVESSACVDEANYDEDLGAEICMKRIKDKVWELLGFLLQTAWGGILATEKAE